MKTYGVSISAANEEVFSCGLFQCVEFCKTYIADEADFGEFQKQAVLMGAYSRKYQIPVRSFHLPFCSSEQYQFAPADLNRDVRDKTFADTKQV